MAHVSGNPTWTNTATTPITAAALENLEANGDYALPTVKGLWLPSYQTLLAWTFDPAFASANVGAGTGLQWLSAIPVGAPMTVTGIVVSINTGNASMLANQCWLGLYDPSGQKVAQTADQSAVWGSAGVKASPFSGGPVSISAGIYGGWGLVNTSSGSMSIAAMPGSTAAVNYQRYRSAYLGAGGATVLPQTAPTPTTQLNPIWMALY